MSNQNSYHNMNNNQSKGIFVLPLIFAIIESIVLVIIPWGYVEYITYQSYDTGTFFGGGTVFIFSDIVAFLYGAVIIGTVLVGGILVYVSYSKVNSQEQKIFLLRGVIFIGISTGLTFIGFFILQAALSSYYYWSMGPAIPVAFIISLCALFLSGFKLRQLTINPQNATRTRYRSPGMVNQYSKPVRQSYSPAPNPVARGTQFCPSCGNPTEGAKFCRNCGASLS